MKYLLDTNIVIEQLRKPTISTPRYPGMYGLSVISEAEIYRLPGMGLFELKLTDGLMSLLTLIPVDSKIARKAAELGRTRKTKLPDLLIAATALVYQIPLITKNVKDFRGIPGLKVQSTL